MNIWPRELLNNLPPGTIAGVNYSGMHDSAVALVAPDGRLLGACALERITRIKQDGRPPDELLESLPWDRIATIAVSTDEQPWTPESESSRLHPALLPEERAEGLVHGPKFREFFEKLPAPKKFVCHQLSHAASAFWMSGLEQALCLTYDGGMHNSPWFGGLYQCSRSEGIRALDHFASRRHAKITSLYTIVTAALGFQPMRHEGKITGLAAFGRPDAACRAELNHLFGPGYFEMEDAAEWLFSYSDRLPPVFRATRRTAEISRRLAPFGKETVAATLQAMAEEHVVEILDRARRAGWWSEAICLSGGLFANVRINQKAQEMGFERIFISPPMTDDGTAAGAALAVASAGEAFAPPAIRSMFLGPRYTPDECRAVLAGQGLRHEVSADPAGEVAAALAAGEVVCVFRGAMEYGPRALGNRSILSQATRKEIHHELNQKLRRTEFMPFAPMTRMEDAEACYPALGGALHAAEFMTITTPCSEMMTSQSPAVVHIDGTARPQIVGREDSPFLHEVLTRYHKLTGIASIINTSFNIHEEPIVCSPSDAVQGFLESGIDLLLLDGGCIVRQTGNEAAAAAQLRLKLGRATQKESRQGEVLAEFEKRLADALAILKLTQDRAQSLEAAAEERLQALYKTTREAEVLRKAAEQRLALVNSLSNWIAARSVDATEAEKPKRAGNGSAGVPDGSPSDLLTAPPAGDGNAAPAQPPKRGIWERLFGK